ncbi:MAG: hypothetical protein R3F34_18220 [Planctomycetota bacterium]
MSPRTIPSRVLLPLLVAPLASCVASRPGGQPLAAFGAEVQVYPAGVIAGVDVRTTVGAGEYLTARVAGNVTNRQDFGEHDDEEGGGYGAGLGYRRYFDRSGEGWLWGARVDLWDLEIDWKDGAGTPGEVSGTTDVLVFQPSLELGYGFAMSRGWRGELVAGLGVEMNFDQRGSDVGEGPIALLGLTIVPAW